MGAVSHELKSPLTGIVGLSNLLKGQKLGELNQRQARYVELIHRSGKKMMRVLGDLLQLTSLIAEQSPETELVNLEYLCRQLYQETLTKLELPGTDSDSDPEANLISAFAQPKLNIELGSDLAIANKLLLSSVLSHLLLETLASTQYSEQLEIDISSAEGTTAISITSQKNSPIANEGGFDFTLAQHLAIAMGARVINRTVVHRCQLTLLLPKNQISSLRLDSVPQEQTTHSKPETAKQTKLTILCLHPELEALDPLANSNEDSNFDLNSCDDNCGLPAGSQHRIIEADSIEQAHNLARIWQIDAIILNGYRIAQPTLYLRSLQEYEHLASLPLITLDAATTEAANQIEGLNVFPCLLPSQCRRIEDLIQVIQIAIES